MHILKFQKGVIKTALFVLFQTLKEDFSLEQLNRLRERLRL